MRWLVLFLFSLSAYADPLSLPLNQSPELVTMRQAQGVISAAVEGTPAELVWIKQQMILNTALDNLIHIANDKVAAALGLWEVQMGMVKSLQAEATRFKAESDGFRAQLCAAHLITTCTPTPLSFIVRDLR